ncbi:hypothetical protein [Corynebacterium sp. TAE3-ERU16]|uniref:hypothetical protein n=1 Tax=Corynebacterium sp. TAE3-ERU16 TaxID=2849493 RepID=UPI001C43D6F2|nr:hypothetical protein [Corynebacterium sp. TAE3-ERU16]MBV7293708.1 hypothetical protein [Corynebacterium sp. TAE3-ERU16]
MALVLLFRSLVFPVDEEVGVVDELFEEVRGEDVELPEAVAEVDSEDVVALPVASAPEVEVLELPVSGAGDDDVAVVVGAEPVEEGSVDPGDVVPADVDSVVDDPVDSVVEDGALVPGSVVGCPAVAAPASSSPMYM